MIANLNRLTRSSIKCYRTFASSTNNVSTTSDATSNKKLYIRRFVDPIDESSLLEICKKYGEIEKSPLIVKQNKGSLAYAIVAFKSSESAQLAMEGLIGDYGLQVDYAITRKNSVSYSKTDLNVSKLDKSISEEDLRKMCESYGAVSRIWMQPNADAKGDHKYAYVIFDKASDAESARVGLQSKGIDVRYSRINPDRVDKRKLYVDQLPPETTDADLIKMFGESTLNIESCRVVVDRLSGVCRGFGYIEFDNEEVAERALDYAQHNGVVARYCYVKKVWRKILYKKMRLYKLKKF